MGCLLSCADKAVEKKLVMTSETALMTNRGANYRGRLPRPAVAVQGNGVLVLTNTYLYFKMACKTMGFSELTIPYEDIETLGTEVRYHARCLAIGVRQPAGNVIQHFIALMGTGMHAPPEHEFDKWVRLIQSLKESAGTKPHPCPAGKPVGAPAP